jgi:hypothetical protein
MDLDIIALSIVLLGIFILIGKLIKTRIRFFNDFLYHALEKQ